MIYLRIFDVLEQRVEQPLPNGQTGVFARRPQLFLVLALFRQQNLTASSEKKVEREKIPAKSRGNR